MDKGKESIVNRGLKIFLRGVKMQKGTKHKKKLTNAQKNFNREVKKDLQERGILPPDKKRLNRKQFALDVLGIVHSDNFNFYDIYPYTIKAFIWMIPSLDDKGKIIRNVTSEQVGVIKVLKLSFELEKFWKKKGDEGISKVTLQELYDEVVKPIIDL